MPSEFWHYTYNLEMSYVYKIEGFFYVQHSLLCKSIINCVSFKEGFIEVTQ